MMLKYGKINQTEYDSALAQDIKSSLKPEQKKPQDITSYFADLVKKDVIEAFMDNFGYSNSINS